MYRNRNLVESTAACLLVALLAGCSREARTVTADVPRTPPTGAGDARIAQYQDNAYQLSQGGRYYGWYGCAPCHSGGASAVDFGSGVFRHGDGFDAVYAFIARGHAGDLRAYERRIPVEQLWQITAYVRSLSTLDPEMRRRQDVDLAAEPQAQQRPQPLR